MDFVIQHSYLIPLLPLIGAAIAGFFGARWLKGLSHWPIWLSVGLSAVLSLTLLFGMIGRAHHMEASEPHSGGSAVHEGHEGEAGEKAGELAPADNPVAKPHVLFNWIQAGSDKAAFNPQDPYNPGRQFRVDAGFWFDPLTAVMLSVVCGIGFFITVFAAGYMKGEEGYFRFFAYLGLFIFMMTILVMGENLIMLYLGWEGVGLCSYLLIGYYYDKPAAREAAKKAFLVNRVGDFGFGLGIMLSFLAFGTVSYFGQGAHSGTGLLELAAAAANPGHPQHWAYQWIPFLLMLGAFGKSAQFPLYVWLPDAMEGPTPVSALIHAATMVTAGVYMIARCGTLFVGNAAAMTTITVVGAFTALFAATIALRQFDLKKVFAYSTISQLGFMFVGVGMLAPVAAVFHLVTHAFFKALLFLSSGVVMHAMAGVLDMRQMSGIRRQLPWTNRLMLVGCLALAGFPLLSGFFSKDEIVGAALYSGNLLVGLVMLFTAFLTAYYTFRLYFRVFCGPEVIPAAPAGGHGAHGGHGTTPDAHATASASAVQSGDVAESGVDTHLAKDTAHHGQAAHGGGGHGHGGHGDGHHNHEPLVMILPLIVLAVGAIFAGYLNFPERHGDLGHFLGKSPSFSMAYEVASRTGQAAEAARFGQPAHEEAGGVNYVMILSAIVAASGIGLAYMLHLKDRARGDALVQRFRPVAALLEAKYWVDEIYQAVIVEPLRWLGRVFFAVDRIIVDGLVGVLSWVPQLAGWSLKLTVQRGSLQGYASAMLFGIVVILVVIFM